MPIIYVYYYQQKILWNSDVSKTLPMDWENNSSSSPWWVFRRILIIIQLRFFLALNWNFKTRLAHLFQEANIIQRDIIPVLNAYINGIKEKRSVGLILLRRILPQCPSDIFIDNASTWMQQCCKWDGETVKEELKILG